MSKFETLKVKKQPKDENKKNWLALYLAIKYNYTADEALERMGC